MSGTSGTYGFAPALSDMALDAMERCGIRTNEVTADHLQSMRRTMNLVQVRWANRGINLWQVDLVAQLMSQEQAAYAVDPATVSVLDTYLRQYQMGAPQNIATAFSTTAGSAVVTIAGLIITPLAGSYISIVVPVAVGGLVLQGFYSVLDIPGSGQVGITAASAATATVTAGGAVPSFATTVGSSTVTVTLAGHGLLVGQRFTVQAQTSVGGLVLEGPYFVASVPGPDTFTIAVEQVAGSAETVSENAGLTRIVAQAMITGIQRTVDPIDILLTPLSRNDYAAIPDKSQQGRPTSYWVDRLINPVINVWQVPDGSGPYELRYYRCRQIQDAVLNASTQADVPYRFYEAYTAEIADHFALKWAPERRGGESGLTAYAVACWIEASDEDREKTTLHLSPDLSSYFN